MYLYEFENDTIIVPIPPFDSSEWFLSVAPMIKDHLLMKFSEREVVETPRTRRAWRDYADGRKTITEVHSEYVSEIVRRIQHELFSKNRPYEVIYKALTEEFNPLWNVDGVETLTYERKNTGTQTNVVDQDDKNKGTQTNTDTTSTTSTSSTTTYDSATWKDTEKNVDANSGAVTRTDNLTYERDQTDTRTDDLTEKYSETKERHGNIGVTRSDQLIEGAYNVFSLEWAKFLDLVTHDIANVITNRVY